MKESQTALFSGWNLHNSYALLPQSLFSHVLPTPVVHPTMVLFNDALAHSLGLLSKEFYSGPNLEICAGNKIPQGATPISQAYAGHQFGHFTMLGDGRAVLLGEQITPLGKQFDIQLKGSGITPYSRNGDGRAALGPMLREYIISEAMHELGIATTRSLAVVNSGQTVMRETELPGAILTRVASSHIRVGTFEYVSHRGTESDLVALANYTIKRHFPYIQNDENRYYIFLQEVIQKQACLIAQWQLVCFIHGVMNTDNMALCGETIDYGPCAFMDIYNPQTVFSSIDRNGRYAYGNQPTIAQWNLARFAETLLPLLHTKEETALLLAQEAVESFTGIFNSFWLIGMRSKLGIENEEESDSQLIADLLTLMEQNKKDYTTTFLDLTFKVPGSQNIFDTDLFSDWYKRWQSRILLQTTTKERTFELMRKSNPALIPRNHIVEEVLAAAVTNNDYTPLKDFLAALKSPYSHTDLQKSYSQTPPQSASLYRTFCGT